MTFPNDAITYGIRNDTQTDNVGVLLLATSTNANPTRTILSSGAQSGTARVIKIYCGSPSANNVLFDNMGSSVTSFQIFTTFKCDKAIYVDSMRKSFTGIVYADYDIALASSTPVTLTVASSTFPSVTASGFTHGDVITGFLLLLLVLMAFFGGILNRVIGVKKDRKLYNEFVGGGDVYEGKLVNYDS